MELASFLGKNLEFFLTRGIYNQKINGLEIDSSAIYKKLEKNKFKFNDTTKILINSKNAVNEIDSYEAKTGVMIGYISFSENNDIYIIIFDYDKIIINWSSKFSTTFWQNSKYSNSVFFKWWLQTKNWKIKT